jgi:hypothetical protein
MLHYLLLVLGSAITRKQQKRPEAIALVYEAIPLPAAYEVN